MSLLRFVAPLDRRSVRHDLGLALQLLGVLLVVPTVVAALAVELIQTAVFAALAAGAWFLGRLAARREQPTLELREALVVSALAYLVYASVGALAFLTVVGPADAFFESMAGFTSTGLTVTDDLQLPASLLFFRAYSQWIGGGGIIILSIVVLSGAGSAATRLYAVEFGPEDVRGSMLATVRIVATAYVALTTAAILALLAAGAGAFDGLLHALALVSTGGFSPFADSVGAYGSAPIAAVTSVVMLLGAVSFPLYYRLWRRDWGLVWRDAQLRALGGLAVLAVVGSLLIHLRDPAAGLTASFDVLSAFTTTGFTLTDPADWPGAQRTLAIGLMVVGGSVGSTTGGIKLLRLVILAKLVAWTFLRTLMPTQAKIPLRAGTEAVGEDELRRTTAFIAAYAGLVFLSTVSLTGVGVSFEDAVFESVSALSNVGQSAGVTSPELPAWTKTMLGVNMWLGRLEVLPVLVLAYPGHWRRAEE